MALVIGNWEARAGSEGARRGISAGKPAIEILHAALRQAESDVEAPTVGAHGLPNILGQAELDASLMDGTTLRTGAVGALSGYAHPISVAYEVMTRLPHVFLVGEGARRFAEECGAEPAVGPFPRQEAEYGRFLDSLDATLRSSWPPPELAPIVSNTGFAAKQKDTAVCLVQDSRGQIASGATTSGWPLKYPGRLGDSPVIGAGHYCHNRYGAAACTHTGEMTLRALTAHTVVQQLRSGASVETACYRALEEVRELQGGTLGPLVIHALDSRGNFFVLSTGPAEPFWIWHEELDGVEEREPKIERL